ncbi:MAG: hypothetical protein D6683_17875, partial [Actinomyces sp.]
TDSVGITDGSPASSSGLAETVTDTVGVTDTASGSTSGASTQTLTDSVGVTDTLVAAVDHLATVTDAVGITDATATVTSTGQQTVTDAIGITDAIETTLVAYRVVVDDLGISDAISPTTTERTWLYEPPTTDGGGHLLLHPVERARQAMTIYPRHGMCVLKVGGVWQVKLTPSVADLEAAEAYYLGGHVHTVTDTIKTELEAAGIGGTFTAT